MFFFYYIVVVIAEERLARPPVDGRVAVLQCQQQLLK